MSPSEPSNSTHALRQPPSPATQTRKTRPIKTSRSTTSGTPTFRRRRRHPILPSRLSFPSASSRLSSPRASPSRPLFRLTGRQAVASAAAYRRGAALACNNGDHHGNSGSVPPSAPAVTPRGTLVLPVRSRSSRVPTTTPPHRVEKGIEEGEDDNEEVEDDADLQVGDDGGVKDRETPTPRMLYGSDGCGGLKKYRKRRHARMAGAKLATRS